MIKILFVVYHFLPASTTHIHRLIRFLNFLAATNKFEITVLTSRNPTSLLYDEGLSKKLNDRIKVARTRAFFLGIHAKSGTMKSYVKLSHKPNPSSLSHFLLQLVRASYRFSLQRLFRLMSIPDEFVGWFPFALLRGRRYIRSNDFAFIITTGPPFSNFLTAALLKRKGIKLIIDYRDPWAGNLHMESYRPAWQNKLNKRLERFVLTKTDVVINNTQKMHEFFLENHSFFVEAQNIKTAVIYNGFDINDKRTGEAESNGTVNFVFSGRFHRFVPPQYFLRAARELIDGNRIEPSEIKVTFIGSNTARDFELFSNIFVDDFCEFLGPVPHGQNLEIIRNSDCLLVFLGSQAHDRIIVPSKIFEYLLTDNLILAQVPQDSETAKILHKAGGELIVPSLNVADIKAVILKIVINYRTKGHLKVKRNMRYLVDNFDVRVQGKKLLDIIESLNK